MKRLLWHLIFKHCVAFCWYMMPEMEQWQEIRTFMNPNNKIGSEADF